MDNKFLEAALNYAGRGWPVFPVSPRSKVPFKGSHGHLDAAADPAAIEAMWRARPGANVALATGRLVVFDCDGREGLDAFAALGKSPRTLVARTPRGLHFYYEAPAGVEIRGRNAPRAAKGAGGLDIKARGGFVLLPPSINRDGVAYAWMNREPIAALADHHLKYAQALSGGAPAGPRLALPPHLAGRAARNLVEMAATGLGLEWSAHEEARVRAALRAIDARCGYDTFFRICCALHQLNWLRPDGTDRGFELLDEWCQRFPEHYRQDGLESKWRSLRADYRYARATVGTLFYHAQQAGWDGTVYSGGSTAARADKTEPPAPLVTEPGALGRPPPEANGHALELPAALTLLFPDTDKAGRPKPTCANAAAAITGLGIECRQDVFHERLIVGGHPIAQWAGDLSDNAVLMLRKVIWREFEFDPGERHARDAAMQSCLEHQFNPVVEYLGALRWDGTERLARWTVTYLGARDNELHREFGRMVLIAAVRRARHPGCKFDQILVLEGPQGAGKSSAIRILAGDDNFSDQHILGASDREQQEAFRGVWLHEIAELAGMRRTDVERVKQFARRTEDRARPAYGRLRQDMKRRGVFVATTNEDEYLKEYDRAFWPITVGRIDLAGLVRDRDQLWAEAARRESRGERIELPERLRETAQAEQRERIEGDPWLQPVTMYLAKHVGDVSIHSVLTDPPLLILPKDISRAMQMRVAKILKSSGYERHQDRIAGKREWVYRKVGADGDSMVTKKS